MCDRYLMPFLNFFLLDFKFGFVNVLLHPVAQSRAYRELLQHKTVFEWTAQREKEWKKLKETVSTEPVLTFFDPSKPKNICTDTSKDSLKKCATPNELR